MEKLIEKYNALREKIKAFDFINYIINWDSNTSAKPLCLEQRAKQIETIAKLEYDIKMSDDSINLINSLYEKKESLPCILKIEIEKMHKNMMKQILVPKEEQIAYSSLLAKSFSMWALAKEKNDFEIFRPYLEKIVDYNRRYVKYVETPTKKGYDILLDEYEEGASVEFYDEFFALLKQEIVPLVKKITKQNKQFINLEKYTFAKEKQKELSEYFMDVMCFDKERGFLKESEHPFTSGFGTTDVRITTHYYEDLLTSNIFSVMHEAGHALYEMQCDASLDDTLLGGGTSLAMHEAQSRFYENVIARSQSFWKTHFKKLQETFDVLKKYTYDEFYEYVNKVENSLIRVEADELTYSLHIMVRYELEKALISGELDVKDLPKKWNELYKEYLNIDVPNDALGVLQDVHWADGGIGYFPTYALGSAYSLQLYNQMKKDIDIDEIIASKKLKQINNWLKSHVHKFGKTKSSTEIILESTNEKFNPKYYIDYLKTKYMKIYNICE